KVIVKQTHDCIRKHKKNCDYLCYSNCFLHFNSFLFTWYRSITRISSTTPFFIHLMVIILKFDITVDDQINKKIDEIDISNKKLESNIKELHRIIEYLVKSNELLVKKNNQLETQNQMQKEFISITAHDLRTSIQSIIWYSELLEIDPQLCEKYVNVKIRNIKRLERLTQSILDVARIENNLLRLDKQRFNLENLILLVINEYKQQLDKDEKSNDLQITYENPKQDDKGIIIYADKARVTQVISNLIENAIKFTTQGKITIT